MVLIESGFTIRRALLFNFISACTAIIGFFIGASIAQDEASRTWIFSITAGTFAYIALVDLVCYFSLIIITSFFSPPPSGQH
jgi:zinc transporter ZupT